MKKKKINTLKRFIRFLIADTIWLLTHYGRLKAELRDDGIDKVIPFKFIFWHSGFNYFTGLKEGKKVFIKVCIGEYNTIATEAKLRKYPSINWWIPKIVSFSLKGIPYIATEFIETKRSSRTLKNEELKLVLNESCQILDTLHENGIVHRDIRPENLMLTDDNRLLLFDFGWAVFREDGYSKSKYDLIEKILNMEYRDKNEKFDDAYAMYQSLKELLGEDKSEDLIDVKNRIGRFVL
ncbi:MAG: protein kinase [Candidatus Methanofastidiosum sp.]|nr:protein kinase [Methanofastidiosum sp.]